MHPKILFPANSRFKELLHDDSNSWIFTFEEDIYASSQGFWRLLQDQEIVWVSLDHGHQFGLPAPVDLVHEGNARLRGHLLQQIEICEGTGDLKLRLSGGYLIEIFIASTGYQTVEFGIDDKRFIGTGGGDYCSFPRGK